MLLQAAEPIRVVERVDLICSREDRFVGQPLARRITARKQRELSGDDVEILDRIASACR